MIDVNDIKDLFSEKRRKAVADALLTPFSWLYGAGVALRNYAFKAGLLKRESFDVPVVSVGNITVGGTGKTPHVEYLIEHLCQRYCIGVLSRGYKRDTSGFILASPTLSAGDLGDEPYQIYHKFAHCITLAVCESRCKGIHEMMRINPDINLFILDDAFQHRYVKPKVNIVLVDFNRLPDEDHLMPLGSLREPPHMLYYSDIIVVTKCPSNIAPIDLRVAQKRIGEFVAADHKLFFSNVRYAAPLPVFPISRPQLTDLHSLGPADTLLGVTGIANHRNFLKYLRRSGAGMVKLIHYGDHHKYSRDDFKYIFRVLDELGGQRKFIITTEKDAVRIINNPYFPPTMRDRIYYIPIKVGFLQSDGEPGFIDEVTREIEARPAASPLAAEGHV